MLATFVQRSRDKMQTVAGTFLRLPRPLSATLPARAAPTLAPAARSSASRPPSALSSLPLPSSSRLHTTSRTSSSRTTPAWIAEGESAQQLLLKARFYAEAAAERRQQTHVASMDSIIKVHPNRSACGFTYCGDGSFH